MARDDRISVGEVVAPHGIRGEVRLRLLSDFPERLPGRTVLLGPEGPEATILRARPFRGGLWLLRLTGVETRSQAEALRGRELLVDARSLPPLPEGRWYHHDIVGLVVVDGDGRTLGRVREVMATGANDVFVVQGDGGEWLVPALASVVREIDPEAGVMRVDLPPGLEPE